MSHTGPRTYGQKKFETVQTSKKDPTYVRLSPKNQKTRLAHNWKMRVVALLVIGSVHAAVPRVGGCDLFPADKCVSSLCFVF